MCINIRFFFSPHSKAAACVDGCALRSGTMRPDSYVQHGSQCITAHITTLLMVKSAWVFKFALQCALVGAATFSSSSIHFLQERESIFLRSSCFGSIIASLAFFYYYRHLIILLLHMLSSGMVAQMQRFDSRMSACCHVNDIYVYSCHLLTNAFYSLVVVHFQSQQGHWKP